MLKLTDIKKDYVSGESVVSALRGVSLEFRESEFVSILGQSGCGKTTLLNIIGGLDKYTSGDLIINGKSTKDFKDKDWDTYRNHSIGFVFQSYNLIPHQTVLANVELALTLSGVSPEERRKRATEVLEKVGLGDQLNKKPNQMSGGQMQRVAIARALVNDPDIILADEPTGALDSKTSVQIMEILKEISKDKLIIMVTHNPEIAKEYSTRIINLLDGRVIDDSNPYTSEKVEKPKETTKKKKSMSFLTALLLSFNNLLTKKGRTFLTAFAGSIGIIGIALILSVSSGVNAYINGVEQSTMASYPLAIQKNTFDMTSMMTSMSQNDEQEHYDDGKVHSNNVMFKMMEMFSSSRVTNNLAKFKKFIDGNDELKGYTNDIKYQYNVSLKTYYLRNGTYTATMNDLSEFISAIMPNSPIGAMISSSAWSELVGDSDFVKSQYDIVDGKFPEAANEIILVVDEYNRVPDYILYMLGFGDMQDILNYLFSVTINGAENTEALKPIEISYEDLLNTTFKVLTPAQKYTDKDGLIVELTEAEKQEFLASSDATELKIVGIVRAKDDSISSMAAGTLAYTSELIYSLIDEINESNVVQMLLKSGEDGLNINPFTGKEYFVPTTDMVPMLRGLLLQNTPSQYQDLIEEMSDAEVLEYFTESYEKNLEKLGYVDKDDPNGILIYPKDFASKDKINKIISDYNKAQSDDDKLTYTDTVALLMSSVTTIVNAISYVLIAFVAISLIVSSIMIGIITYISVLERTKEIGILRAIGASKKDISRVFNAETLIVGFGAGAIGIIVTLILNIFINIILHHVTGIATLSAKLPVIGAIVLVLISMFLTFIAGLIPSRIAAKKDPVIALRTE